LNEQNAVNSSGQNNSNAPSPDEWQDHFRGFDSCEFVKLCLDRATRGISCLPQERDADPIAILRPKNSPIGKPGRRKQQKKTPSDAGARSQRLGSASNPRRSTVHSLRHVPSIAIIGAGRQAMSNLTRLSVRHSFGMAATFPLVATNGFLFFPGAQRPH
jgi:hypothetical protein